MKESHYYVNIPGQDFPSAEVEADSTKHARTAYLDYLSRGEYIGWRERQAWRGKVVTKRMKYPGEIKTQVYLDYDGLPALTQDFEESPVEATPALDAGEMVAHQRDVRDAIEAEEQDGRPAGDHFMEEQERRENLSPMPPKSPWDDSPIANLSRKSRGM